MRSVLAGLVLVCLLLSACTGSPSDVSGIEGEAGLTTSQAPGDPTSSSQAARPTDLEGFEVVEGAEGSAACVPEGTNVRTDINRTFEGPAHTHDMWGGQKELVVFDGQVRSKSATGINTAAFGFEMPGFVVHPGANRLDFKLTWSDPVLSDPRTLSYDPPGDKKAGYTDLVFAASGNNHSISFNLSANDPPHYTHTTWLFKISKQAHIVATIYRGYDCLPIDPPHYDGWAGATEKQVWQARNTHANTVRLCTGSNPGEGCSGSNLNIGVYPPGNSSIPPGTQTVRVTLSWENSVANQPPLCVLYKTAAQPSTTVSAHRQATNLVEDSSTRRVYEITPSPEDWDSPYHTATKWNFNWCFDGAADAGLFNGSVTWDVVAIRGSS